VTKVEPSWDPQLGPETPLTSPMPIFASRIDWRVSRSNRASCSWLDSEYLQFICQPLTRCNDAASVDRYVMPAATSRNKKPAKTAGHVRYGCPGQGDRPAACVKNVIK
jgi:hypothetical protein